VFDHELRPSILPGGISLYSVASTEKRSLEITLMISHSLVKLLTSGISKLEHINHKVSLNDGTPPLSSRHAYDLPRDILSSPTGTIDRGRKFFVQHTSCLLLFFGLVNTSWRQGSGEERVDRASSVLAGKS
jgi:hypothetical protein